MITTNEELQMLQRVFSHRQLLCFLWQARAWVLKSACCRVLQAALSRRALRSFALFVLTLCSELNTS